MEGIAGLQPYVTPVPLVVLGLAQLASLLAFAGLMLGRKRPIPGWRAVEPGGMHWFCFLGSWVFATVLSWVWLFVGSARNDAEAQMRYLLILALVFGIAAAFTGFYMLMLRRKALRWRGTSIRWRKGGRDLEEDMRDFEAWRRPVSGLFHLRFSAGTILKLDMYARNAEELAVAISERNKGKFEFI
jgi:hypothetical protein